jgi:chromosome segregation ATPase
MCTLHVALAELYPETEPMSGAVETLLSKEAALKGAKEAVDDEKAAFDKTVADLLARHKELAKLADDRAGLRVEISHYQEKIDKMVAKPNPKEEARLEENRSRLAATQKAFDELDAKLAPQIASLDKDIGAMTDGAIRGVSSVGMGKVCMQWRARANLCQMLLQGRALADVAD